ncbi:MAG: tetratricopeptide repeat protein [Bacteroidota bacterium]
MKFIFTLLLACSFTYSYSQMMNSRSGMVSTSEDARSHFQQGYQALQSKLYKSAKSYFLRSTQADPKFVDALDYLAETYRDLSMLDSTIFYYEKSLKIYPRNLLTHQNLAAAYQLKSEYNAAILQYKNLLLYYPGYPEAFYGMALSYFNLAKYDEARVYSENAMRSYLSGGRNENAADARMLAARCYLELNENKTALKYFNVNKKYFKEKPIFHYYKGLAYLKMEKGKEARSAFDKATELGFEVPSHIQSRLEFLLSKS